MTLTDTHGVLAATGDRTGDTVPPIQLTISGTLSQVNADLTTLTDTNGTASTDNITVQATDSFHNSATPQTVDVTVNGAPYIAGPSQILHMSQSDPLSGVSVSETGNTAGETFTVTLHDSTGILSATGGSEITGNDSHDLTITGNLLTVNSDLATLQDAVGAAGNATVTVNVSDGFGNSATPKTIAIIDATTVSETVSALSGNENTAILLNGISVSDTPSTGDTLTTTLAVSHGNITVAATSGVTISDNDSGSVTLTGTAAAIDAALASTSTNYTGDTNYYGADSLTVTTTDPSSISSNNTVSQTVGITLADTTAVAETVSALSGNENTAILLNGHVSVSDTPNTGDTLTTTLAVSHGNITVAATSGVTISDNDSGLVTLTGTAAAIDAALASTSTNYTGATNYYGADSLTVTTTDPSSISSNNTVSQTVGITLADTTAVAETVSALSGNENTAILLNGHVSVSDTPNTGDTLTTTLAVSHGNITVAATSGVTISDNDSGLVTLTGTAAAIDAALASTSTNYTGATNYYGADSLTVTTIDPSSISSNNTVSQTVGITLADTTAVAETVSALSGNENTAILLNGHYRCRIRRTPATR